MGQALAGRLIDAGHEITVWNRTRGRADDLLARGAREANSVADAAGGADAVLVSLSGDDAVRQVLLPDGKPIAGLDGVVIDCSTVDPMTSREESGHYPGRFVACPIAGAPQAVASGTALLIVAGSADAVQRAGPVLDSVSGTRQTAGEDAGTAAIIKLLNNYLLLSGLVALADVVAVAQANGFENTDLHELLGNLPTVAPALTNRIDGLLEADHEPWFSVDLGRKDLGLFAGLADRAGARPGLADTVQACYRDAAELGLGDRDLTAVIEVARREPASPA
jgi:3-hydroxyisobutyrate dehydrogenase